MAIVAGWPLRQGGHSWRAQGKCLEPSVLYIFFLCLLSRMRLYFSIFSVDKFPNCSASYFESLLCGRYCTVSVIAGALDDRNSAVTVIARWAVWASSGERVAGNSGYYIFSLCLLSVDFTFYEFFLSTFYTLLEA